MNQSFWGNCVYIAIINITVTDKHQPRPVESETCIYICSINAIVVAIVMEAAKQNGLVSIVWAE